MQWQALLGWLSSYAGAGGGASGSGRCRCSSSATPSRASTASAAPSRACFEAARELRRSKASAARCSPATTRGATRRAVVHAVNRGVRAQRAPTREFDGFRRTPPTRGRRRAGRAVARHRCARPMPSAAAAAPHRVARLAHRAAPRARDSHARKTKRAAWRRASQRCCARRRRRRRRDRAGAAQAPWRAWPRRCRRCICRTSRPRSCVLADVPEVRDLVAVLDVLASPAHDLVAGAGAEEPVVRRRATTTCCGCRSASAAHAAAAGGRALTAWHDAPPALQRARELLARWAAAARHLPPHDLLDRVVHEGDLLARLAAAVPADAARRGAGGGRCVARALALRLDGGRYASVYRFVRALRQRALGVRRAPRAADAVQLLTVHGAKGLEARCVFIMDAEPGERQEPEPGAAGRLAGRARRAAPRGLRRRPRRAARRRCAVLRAREQAARAARGAQRPLRRDDAGARAARRSAAPTAAGNGRERGGRACCRTARRCGGRRATGARRAPPSRRARRSVQRCCRAAAAATGSAAGAGASRSRRTPRGSARRCTACSNGPAAGAAASARLRRAGRRRGGASWRCRRRPARAVPMRRRIFDSRRCRRFFDPAALAWAGNEVRGRRTTATRCALDRLVAFDAPAATRTWWVLDYKLQPDAADAPALRAAAAPLPRRRAPLQPGDAVHAAFITGDGASDRAAGLRRRSADARRLRPVRPIRAPPRTGPLPHGPRALNAILPDVTSASAHDAKPPRSRRVAGVRPLRAARLLGKSERTMAVAGVRPAHEPGAGAGDAARAAGRRRGAASAGCKRRAAPRALNHPTWRTRWRSASRSTGPTSPTTARQGSDVGRAARRARHAAPPTWRAGCCRRSGLAFAHEAGLAHRDLQPHMLVIERARARARCSGLGRALRRTSGGAAGRAGARLSATRRRSAQRRRARRAGRRPADAPRCWPAQPALDEADIGRVIERLPPRGREMRAAAVEHCPPDARAAARHRQPRHRPPGAPALPQRAHAAARARRLARAESAARRRPARAAARPRAQRRRAAGPARRRPRARRAWR